MALTTDELAMRTALHELADTQPDAPVDRVAGVRRRHLRRRRAQAVVAAAAVVLAVVGTIAGTSAARQSHGTQLAHRSVPTWALPWPDHVDPAVDPAIRHQAIEAWKSQTYGTDASAMYDPKQVVWYLTARVTPRHDIVVVFEVQRDDGDRRLVAGYLTDVTTPDSAGNWVFYDDVAPDPKSPVAAASFYLPELGDDEVGADNWVVLVTNPTMPVALLDHVAEQQVQLDRGYAVTNAGPLGAQVLVSLVDKHGQSRRVGIVGLPGVADSQVPSLAHPAELVGVPQGKILDQSVGQGPELNLNGSPPAEHGRTVIYARCYGGASISVTVDSQSRAAVTIPCDNQQHVVDGPALKPGGDTSYQAAGAMAGHSTGISAGKLVPWRVAVVIR